MQPLAGFKLDRIRVRPQVVHMILEASVFLSELINLPL